MFYSKFTIRTFTSVAANLGAAEYCFPEACKEVSTPSFRFFLFFAEALFDWSTGQRAEET